MSLNNKKYFFIVCFILISQQILFAEPILNIEQFFEKKSVLTGKEIKGKLVLKNKGDELLKIHGISSTCGCHHLEAEREKAKSRR